jgi:hypothetical protein
MHSKYIAWFRLQNGTQDSTCGLTLFHAQRITGQLFIKDNGKNLEF